MTYHLLLWLGLLLLPTQCLNAAIETDNVIFVFDNGDKNMVASALTYARKHDPQRLDAWDFRIVFMGASVDAMQQYPFSELGDRIIHYKELGVIETIDRYWKRGDPLSNESLHAIAQSLIVRRRVYTPVSASLFAQILKLYQTTVFRDNPHRCGDSDYFAVADAVQQAASRILVPSNEAARADSCIGKEIVIIGHGPIEQWVEEAVTINRTAVIERLGLDPSRPIVVYAGGYGEGYLSCFKVFVRLVEEDQSNTQILVVPHPRFGGELERELSSLRIVGSDQASTLEALCIADAVVVPDATSTIVLQAGALGKDVWLVTPALREKTLLPNLFDVLGIPHKGAQMFWQELMAD